MNMVKGMDEAKDEETGQIFTPQEIIDEFITIRGAGHETTSNTLSWAMMLLAENPSIQEGTFEGRFIGVSVLI
jgi:cytochrome P450